MSRNYLTLTRQALYDLVWFRPMSSLAQDFGISDVALAKRCEAVSIPVPPRGYWARVAAGQKPPQPPLPRYRTPEPDSSTHREAPRSSKPARPLRPPQTEALTPEEPVRILKRDPPPPKIPLGPEHEALAVRLQDHPPTLRADLRGAHAAVRRTALNLKAQRVQDMDWTRGERAGPILSITATPATTHRALRIADAVLRTAETLNWPFEAPKKEPDPYRSRYRDHEHTGPIWGLVMVEGEPLQITVTERQKRVPHVLTPYEKQRVARGEDPYTRPWDLGPTGQLRLNLARPDGYVFKTFQDGAKHRLEEQVTDAFHAMLDHALDEKRRREQRRIAELERREQERLAAEQRERRDAHAELVKTLENHAGAWHRARYLRRYVSALRRASGGQTIEAMLGDEPIDFIAWAERYLNQLDPLHDEPRHADMAPDPSPYYRSNGGSEDLQKTLARLTGQNWSKATKLHAFSSTDEGPDDD